MSGVNSRLGNNNNANTGNGRVRRNAPIQRQERNGVVSARNILNSFEERGKTVTHIRSTPGRGVGIRVTSINKNNRIKNEPFNISRSEFRNALINSKASKIMNNKNKKIYSIEKINRNWNSSNIQNKKEILNKIKNIKNKLEQILTSRESLVNHLKLKIPNNSKGDYTYDPFKKIFEYIKKVKTEYSSHKAVPQMKTLIKSSKIPNNININNIHQSNFEFKNINKKIKKHTFNFNNQKTIEFFTNMYIDMWHDSGLTIDRFKPIFNKFIDVNENNDLYFNQIRQHLPRRLSEDYIKGILLEKITNINNARLLKISGLKKGTTSNINRNYKSKEGNILMHLDADKNGILHDFTETIFNSRRKYSIGLPKYYDAGMYLTPAEIGTNILGIRRGRETKLVFDLNGFSIKLNFDFDGLDTKTTTIDVSRNIPTRNKPYVTGKIVNVLLNGKRIKASTAAEARAGVNNNNTIGKFFGDFLQICKVIIDQKYNTNAVFSTFDKSAMNLYLFMSNNSPNKKCIFLEQSAGQRSQRTSITYTLYLINMNDLITRMNRSRTQINRNTRRKKNALNENINASINKMRRTII